MHSVLRDGQEAAYEAAHATVPGDLLALLKRAGVEDWVIWRSGRHLFHVVECADFDAAMREMAGDPVNDRWQAVMAAHVERFEDGPGGGRALRQVWSLRGQAGDPGG
jgi:L-rhamnose mutarotase